MEAFVSGPECKKLVGKSAGNGEWVFRGALAIAGCYSIRLSLDGTDLPSWPRQLYVQADPSKALDCHLVALAPVFLAGCEARIVAALYDGHGNSICSGGSCLSATAAQVNGKGVADVAIMDNLDGTYGLTFHASQPGK